VPRITPHIPEALTFTRDGGEFALVFQTDKHQSIAFHLTTEQAYYLKVHIDITLIMAMD